jgi:hypothetical protein
MEKRYQSLWNVVMILVFALTIFAGGCKDSSNEATNGNAVDLVGSVSGPGSASNANEGVSFQPGVDIASEATPAEPYHIWETLKDGQTQGEILNGTLTPQGLQFQGVTWYIKYVIPTTTKGYLQFTAQGFVPNEFHPELGGLHATEYKSVLISMWNDIFPYCGNQHLIEVSKYGYIKDRPDATDCIVFSAQGGPFFHEDSTFSVLPWDETKAYVMRLEWEPDWVSFYRDGELVDSHYYQGMFAPDPHVVYIGVPPVRPFALTPANILVSDVTIGPRE